MSPVIDALLEIRDTFSHHVIFAVGVLLVLGYFVGRIAERCRLPAITGYLVCGLLLGDSVTGIIHAEMTETLRTITDVALGIIAITIGSEFSLGKLRRLGKGIVVITLTQLVATFLAVTGVLTLCRLPLPYAAILGAIASATAPAATVVIIQNLRARGDFVDTLYGVVALDDAGCVVLFAGVFALASMALGSDPAAAHGSASMIGHALLEVVLSVGLGIVEGLLIHLFTRRLSRQNEMFIISLGSIFLFTAIAISLHLSLLLTNMAAGAVLVNLSRRGARSLRVVSPLTPPLYAAFFAIAGTELQLEVLASGRVLLLGTAYVLARAIGKYSGVWVGAHLAGSPRQVRNWLGFSMLPQAGVAIGLVLLIQASPLLAHASDATRLIFLQLANVVLFAVMINELVGPPLSKFAIVRGADL